MITPLNVDGGNGAGRTVWTFCCLCRSTIHWAEKWRLNIQECQQWDRHVDDISGSCTTQQQSDSTCRCNSKMDRQLGIIGFLRFYTRMFCYKLKEKMLPHRAKASARLDVFVNGVRASGHVTTRTNPIWIVVHFLVIYIFTLKSWIQPPSPSPRPGACQDQNNYWGGQLLWSLKNGAHVLFKKNKCQKLLRSISI